MVSIALSLHDVTVSRSGRDILRAISLDVAPGEVLALVGPNGAGKSTLLGVMAGEIRPSAGRVEVFGRAIRSYRTRELATKRAILLQSNAVNFPFLVSEVVAMGRNPWAGSDDEAADEDKIAWAMERTGVTDLADRRFAELSGGEQARVSLARVIAQDTPVVLLDEPTAALDMRHQDHVMDLVDQLAEAGRAVVVVLHDLPLAAAYANRVALMAQGTVVADGEPASVFSSEQLSAVYGVEVEVATTSRGQVLAFPAGRPATPPSIDSRRSSQ